jgi:Fe-S-cluster containining protein
MSKQTKAAVFRKLQALYARMDAAYDEAAEAMGLTCDGCADNCCTSFFQHHTYVEWAYLWQGLRKLPEAKRDEFLDRARRNVEDAQAQLARGRRPAIMCPLNEDGLCGLYEHRMMICRLHGVPNTMRAPRGGEKTFPGCHRAQELAAAMEAAPVVDRTPLYQELARLEMALLGRRAGKLPRVDHTLAQLMVMGPPNI